MSSASLAPSAALQSARLLRWLGTLVRDFGATLRAAREVERLLNCSDRELEQRGLRRSEIVPHVYGRIFTGDPDKSGGSGHF